jgi:DNA polymerase-3 subunit delta'
MSEAIEQIQKALTVGKLSGSWMIIGTYGVGKKELANQICSLLLGHSFQLENGFHPDVKWIECGLTEEVKKEIQKTILAGKTVDDDIMNRSRKREITVDDIREGIQFLSLRAGDTGWRILIVNLADQMNENAANALLKVLEEPMDRSLILLLCQNVGKLLPTIRSRCRQIVLRPVSQSEIIQKLKELYPDSEDIDLVASLSGGSLGVARNIYDNDGIRIYRDMVELCVPTSQLSIEKLRNFSEYVSKKNESFSLLRLFLFDWLHIQIKQNAITQPIAAETWLEIYEEIERLFFDIERIYLDKKQVIMQSFLKIAGILG